MCIISVPSPGKFCLLILGGRRSSRHRWQPALSPASRRHNLAAPSSLPCCKAPTLAVQLARLSPAFPALGSLSGRGWSSGIPLHPCYPFLSREMFFIQAIVFSFLPGLFSNFSTAAFNSAFLVGNTELSWESKLWGIIIKKNQQTLWMLSPHLKNLCRNWGA